MLWIGDKKVGRLFVGGKAVAALYRGATLIWSAIRSCFGAGFWADERPWKNEDGWKN